MDNSTHTLKHCHYQLNQIATLLQIAITKYSPDNETDTLIRVSFDKIIRVLSQVGDVINAETVMENSSESP